MKEKSRSFPVCAMDTHKLRWHLSLGTCGHLSRKGLFSPHSGSFCCLFPLCVRVQSSRRMTFSPTPAPGTRQLLLTCFLGVPVCIKRGIPCVHKDIPLFDILYCNCTRPIDSSNSSILSVLAAILCHLLSNSKSVCSIIYFLSVSEGSPSSSRSSRTASIFPSIFPSALPFFLLLHFLSSAVFQMNYTYILHLLS